MEICMILDASSVIRKVAKRILASDELSIIEAESSADALSIASEQMPDYIIVDAGINDGRYEDVIRRLRALDVNNNSKIICCMTQIDLVSMARAKRAGANDFLLKPFNRQQLLGQFVTIHKAA